MQERVESGLVEAYIEHQQIDRFIINTHAFHNAHLLRATLPRSLVAPSPLFPDRQLNHFKLAQRLRSTQESKRAAAKVRAANKKLAATNDTEGLKKRKRLNGEETEEFTVGSEEPVHPSTRTIPVQLPVASLLALHALGILPVSSLPPPDHPQPPAVMRGSSANGTMLNLEINVSLLQPAQVNGLAMVVSSFMSRGVNANSATTSASGSHDGSNERT
jgi:hypothetical protein